MILAVRELAVGSGGAWAQAAIIAGVLIGAYILTMWLAAVLWTWRDIRSRTHDGVSQWVCTLVVAVFNLPGLLLYLLLRPSETFSERAERQLEIDAFAREVEQQSECPSCSRKVDAAFVACPYCRETLAAPCASCGRNLATAWVLCPYCRAPRTAEAAPARPAAAASNGRDALRAWRNPGRPRTQPATSPMVERPR